MHFRAKFQGLASNWPTVFTRDTTNDSAKARTSLELGTMAGKFVFLGEKGGKKTHFWPKRHYELII